MNMPITTPRYGHQPIPMRCIGTLADEKPGDIDSMQKPGDYCFVRDANGKTFIWLAVPAGLNRNPEGFVFGRLPVQIGSNAKGEHWGWDGNETAPTLTPSVHTVGHWHGFVTKGQLVEA